jgi:CBS domain-containing protein
VTDRGALSWFASEAQKDSTFLRYLSNTLSSLPLPSLYLYTSVVAVTPTSTVLDAMSLMSDEGVSSVAVTVEEDGRLLSAISVADIGKVGFLSVNLCPLH